MSLQITTIHNKLIRDGITKQLQDKGIKYSTTRINGEDKIKALEKKVLEEFDEYLEHRDVNELADLMEVIFGLARALGTYEFELNQIRLDKRVKLGGFEEGIFLKETIE